MLLVTVIGLWFASLSAYALDPTRERQQFRHTSWTNAQGMPGHIFAIAQTPDGYLWVGAASGLYRFDGIHVERLSRQPPGGYVAALAVSNTGDLWIGSSKGLSRLSHGVLTPVPGPSSFTSPGILFIAPGRNGEVYVANFTSVARVDRHGWRQMKSDWGNSGGGFSQPGGLGAGCRPRRGGLGEEPAWTLLSQTRHERLSEG
ncbi:MAG: ligand-binding sensor domain-containing protein [Caulobacteraceae bacterium]